MSSIQFFFFDFLNFFNFTKQLRQDLRSCLDDNLAKSGEIWLNVHLLLYRRTRPLFTFGVMSENIQHIYTLTLSFIKSLTNCNVSQQSFNNQCHLWAIGMHAYVKIYMYSRTSPYGHLTTPLQSPLLSPKLYSTVQRIGS